MRCWAPSRSIVIEGRPTAFKNDLGATDKPSNLGGMTVVAAPGAQGKKGPEDKETEWFLSGRVERISN